MGARVRVPAIDGLDYDFSPIVPLLDWRDRINLT